MTTNRQLLMISFITFIVAISFFRLSAGWSMLVRDVGASGAWIVSGIFQLIYVTSISCGLVVAYKVLSFFSVLPRMTMSIITSITIILTINILSIYKYIHFDSHILFFLTVFFISLASHLLIQLFSGIMFELKE